MTAPRWIDADAIAVAVPVDRARRLLAQALRDGLDPAADPPRGTPKLGAGQLLIMPSATAHHVGVKVLSVAPDNPTLGLPRIQAWYVLMDAATLTPLALLDGAALTGCRTPATSAVAIDALAAPRVDEVVLIGAGPQALAHADAIAAIRSPERIVVAGRHQERTRAAAARLLERGMPARPLIVRPGGSAPEGPASEGSAQGDGLDEALAEAVRRADLVVCATSSATPVLAGEWVRPGACVVAIGSHEPDRRELDAALLGRSQVVVEDVATALREAGDIVLAIAEGTLAAGDLRTLTQVARGEVRHDPDRPNVFKSVGMAWQDVVVAEGAYTALTGP